MGARMPLLRVECTSDAQPNRPLAPAEPQGRVTHDWPGSLGFMSQVVMESVAS